MSKSTEELISELISNPKVGIAPVAINIGEVLVPKVLAAALPKMYSMYGKNQQAFEEYVRK